jgi:hypothetical protein
LRVRALDASTWPAFAALVERHALEEIGRSSGGTVESYPEDTDGRRVSGSFLHNGTLAMFESRGFERTRRIGKHRWVVASVVRPTRG